jgi:kynureninase
MSPFADAANVCQLALERHEVDELKRALRASGAVRDSRKPR